MQIGFLVEPLIRGVDFANFVRELLPGLNLACTEQPKDFLTALAVLRGAQADAWNPGADLRHLSYSIVIAGDQRLITVVQSSTSLYHVQSITNPDDEGCIILSGTLQDFRTEIINGCSRSSHKLFRQYTTLLLSELDKRGLGYLFSQFTRNANPSDASLLLEQRR